MALRDTCQGWVEDIFGGGMFSDVQKVLELNPSTGDYSDVWGIVSSIYENVCIPIGMGLVLIYFLTNVIDKSTQQQNFDLEHMVKLLLKLFIGLYFVEHGLELMTTIYSLGFAFLSSIIDELPKAYSMGDIKEAVWKDLTGEKWEGSWGKLEGLMNFISVGFQILIPYLVTLVMKIIVNFVCYTRLIEFYIKTAAAPIALSDFFTEGVHSNGWKFLKGYIAIALQAGIIMLAVVIFNAIAGSLLASEDITYWGFLTRYLALGFATIGVMLKSLSLTKEVVGAN